MKSIFLALAALFLFAACSGDSYGGGGAPAGNEWTSACLRDQDGNFIEKLVLRPGGTGTVTSTYFQNQDCTGQILRTDGPTNFTYQTDEKAMADGRPVEVTLNLPGKQPSKLNVQVQGNTMTITSADGGTVRYSRTGPPPQKPGNDAATTAAFDAAAVGSWVSENCYQGQQGTTVMLVVQILGGGKGVSLQNVFQNATCQGDAQPQERKEFTYKVDRFAAGAGQITVDGKTVMNITIQGKSMTATSPQGSVSYTKVK